jgi:nitroimidazol reductase NimA-like FMN-containing flavoprotein (pyridoxamine 5'-phosphate oxidase superfamily)
VTDVEPLLAVQRSSYATASEGLRAAWPEAQALDAPQMASLLAESRYGVLATARRDGRAHAAPVGFVVAGGSFWIATVEGLRLRNVRATPWASIVVMDGAADEGEEGAPHRALTAEGPVVLHDTDAWSRFEREWVDRHTDPPDWAEAFIELRPQRLFSHAAG